MEIWGGTHCSSKAQMSKKIYLCPTYHPAGESNIIFHSKKYEIWYYNFTKNERVHIPIPEYNFRDLKLGKFKSLRFDFAVTNTFPIAYFIYKERPKEVVTEDYLFALPYLLVCKLIGTKIIFFNSNTGALASRLDNYLVKFVKCLLLAGFDEYWHGFDGADKYIKKYLDVKSIFVPRLRIKKVAIQKPLNKLHGVYIGEFSSRKRIEYLLELERRCSQQECLKIDLIGAKKNDPFFEEKFQAIPREQVLEQLSSKHFLLLLSDREAMGSVIFEALAHGLFVVMSTEIGAKPIIYKEPSFPNLRKGVEYFNRFGCIIDTSQISENKLAGFLVENEKVIMKNRSSRQELVLDYLVDDAKHEN